MLSDNSMASAWIKKEVTYAKNTGKRVIPVLLKGSKIKGWLLFEYGLVDCIDSTNSKQIDKLLKNLSDWTGKGIYPETTNENENVTRDAAAPTELTPNALVPAKKALNAQKGSKAAVKEEAIEKKGEKPMHISEEERERIVEDDAMYEDFYSAGYYGFKKRWCSLKYDSTLFNFPKGFITVKLHGECFRIDKHGKRVE